MVTDVRRPRRGALARPFRSAWSWWTGLEAAERVLYRTLALLGIGCGLVYPPLLFIVPGIVLALAFFGFGRRR